jgi:hypothetical protein
LWNEAEFTWRLVTLSRVLGVYTMKSQLACGAEAFKGQEGEADCGRCQNPCGVGRVALWRGILEGCAFKGRRSLSG